MIFELNLKEKMNCQLKIEKIYSDEIFWLINEKTKG